MSEELNEQSFGEGNAPEQSSLLPGFKSVCARIGAMMIVVFASRALCSILLFIFGANSLRGFQRTLVEVVSAMVFLNFIPIIAGIFIMRFSPKKRMGELYAKPRYFARSFGIFPAGYGTAIACSFVTALIGLLFQGTPIEDSFTGVSGVMTANDPASMALRAFHAVIFAPIFEEFWFRGMVMHSLKPYGNGFAIFVSAMLFGLTHANLGQFLYTTAIGVVLGYVAVQTGSIITTTVMHALFNMIGTVSSFLMNDEVQDYLLLLGTGYEPEPTPPVIVFLVWISLVLLFALVGFVMAIVKLAHIRRYRVPQVQTELSAGKRWGVFLSRPTVIIMLLMAFDTMTFVWVTTQILKLIGIIFY